MFYLKKILVSNLFFIIFILSPASILVAGDRNFSLGRVIVTDSSDKENVRTGDVYKGDATGFVSEITKDSFQDKIESISDVLEREAGIQIKRSGGLGSFTSVTMRGASNKQVLIYIDGVLVNDASGGQFDLSTISLSDVESIEVYRGLVPLNFSRSSIGGIINVRTKRAKGLLNAVVSAGYGSFNTIKATGFINHKPGKFDYVMNLDYLSSDNNFKFLYNNGTEYNSQDDEWVKRKNNRFHQENLLTKLGYDFTKKIRLEISNQFFNKKQGLPALDNGKYSPSKAYLDTMRDILTLSIGINDVGPLNFNTLNKVSYFHKNEVFDDSLGEIGLGVNNQKKEYITEIYGYNFFLEWPTIYNVLSIIFDFQRQEFDSKDLLGEEDYGTSSRNSYTVGIEDTVYLFKESLIIRPALRYHFIHDNMENVEDLGTEITEGRKLSKGFLSPQVGLKYCPFKWINLKTNLARYVREPSLFELYGDRGFFLDNPELKEERGINFDVGFEINIERKKKILRRISFNGAYFLSNVDDIITYVYDSRGVGRAVNISKSEIMGIESGFVVDIMKYISFSFNYTWQNAVNKSEIDAFNGKKLPGKFDHSLYGKIEGKYRWFKLYLETSYDNGMFYDTANLYSANNRLDFNIGVSAKLWDLTLTFEAKNIGNSQYEDFHRYPLPGRSFYVTLKYNYLGKDDGEKKPSKDKKDLTETGNKGIRKSDTDR
ncbi:TonB-dependent receptor [Spirochaetota bacterium]